MKRIGKVLAIALFASVVWTSAATAAPGWFTSEVKGVGFTSSGVAYVRLTHISGTPVFTNIWFKVVDASVQRELLAIALTAVSNDQDVLARLDPATDTVIHLFLLK